MSDSDFESYSRRWRLLPDPHKPSLPYKRGHILSVTPHTPPDPFGNVGYKRRTGPRQRETGDHLSSITQSEFCLRYPPTETPRHPDTTPRSIRIIDQLACGDGRGIQVVTCSLDNKVYVAKIYDPLYYYYGEEGTGGRFDVTLNADEHYSREAAGYGVLQEAGVDGSLVPKYHGSWSFETSLLNSSTKRSV